MLLVEGDDLAALEDRLYVRTIAGLKRVDALWRRLDPRLLDPLAFDSHSRIGVPGLIDVWAQGNVVLANAPGAGVLESPAFGAFLPQLSTRLTGADLILHGHNHVTSTARIAGPDGRTVPVIGAPSASARPDGHGAIASRRASYLLFEIGRAEQGYAVTARRRARVGPRGRCRAPP